MIIMDSEQSVCESAEPEEKQKSLERLLKICDLILLGEQSEHYAWLTKLDASLKASVTTPTNLTFGYKPGGRGYHGVTTNSLHQLLTLFRDCLLHLRYEEALEFLKVIIDSCRTNMPMALENVIYRGGMELMYCVPEHSHASISMYVNQLKLLKSSINTQQLLIEYCMHLLSTGCQDEAREAASYVPKLNPAISQTPEGKYTSLLSLAYRGLLSYLEWRELKDKMSQGQSSQQMLSQSTVHNYALRQKAEQLAENAITDFECLVGQPGVWDMFITRYSELLIDMQQPSEALRVLQTYKATCCENPNAYKYLYAFLMQHGKELLKDDCSQETIQLLTEINIKWPSDLLAEELIEILSRKEDTLVTAVPMFFSLLDYACHRHNAMLWTKFEAFIRKALCMRECVACVSSEWIIRANWWPGYLAPRGETLTDLDVTKQQILSLLNTVTHGNNV